MNDKKEIDIDRFYWNPTKKEKIYSHYTNGEEIKLSEEDKKKAEEAKLACIKRSINEVKSDVNERKKPLEKRGRKAKIVEPKKE